MSLTLDAFELSRTRGVVEGDMPLEDMPELASEVLGLEGGAVHFRIEGLGIVERLPAALLTIEAGVVMQCARCNEPVTVPVSRELTFRFTKTEEEANALPIDEEGENEEVIVGSKKLSAAAWIQEEVILSLPAMPLHEDCEAEWEDDEEPAPEEEKPNPFAALAALRH